MEKFEVLKNGKSYYYTGVISQIEDDRVLIHTIRDEKLWFWKNQIIGSQVIGDEDGRKTD